MPSQCELGPCRTGSTGMLVGNMLQFSASLLLNHTIIIRVPLCVGLRNNSTGMISFAVSERAAGGAPICLRVNQDGAKLIVISPGPDVTPRIDVKEDWIFVSSSFSFRYRVSGF